MDQELRNSLWNALQLYVWDHVTTYGSNSFFRMNPEVHTLFVRLWLHHFKRPVDNLDDNWPIMFSRIRQEFFNWEWHEVYDFVEFVAINYPYADGDKFINACNYYMERECSAYRFVDGLITRITDEEEISEIELALDKAGGPVRTHLRRALELLSDRENPDYRNSIKESISAVESLTAIVLGQKGTLGQLIKKLEDEIGLHPALRAAFSSLYGYTSDESGIRHAIMESKAVNFEDAKFFLVACSAFANFVTAKVAAPKRKGS
jgi:hypothetical protein